MTNNEKKFWDILTNLFVGAEVKGKSGFINLMVAKQSYFKKVKIDLLKQINDTCKDNKDFDRSAFFNVHFSLHHPISAARYPSSATQPTGRKRQETPNILFNKSLRVLAIFAISLPVGRKYANLKPLFKWLTISVLYF